MRVAGEGERVRRRGRYLLVHTHIGGSAPLLNLHTKQQKSAPLEHVEEVGKGPAPDAEDGLHGHVALDRLGLLLAHVVLPLQRTGKLSQLILYVGNGSFATDQAKEGGSGSGVRVVCGRAAREENQPTALKTSPKRKEGDAPEFS